MSSEILVHRYKKRFSDYVLGKMPRCWGFYEGCVYYYKKKWFRLRRHELLFCLRSPYESNKVMIVTESKTIETFLLRMAKGYSEEYGVEPHLCYRKRV